MLNFVGVCKRKTTLVIMKNLRYTVLMALLFMFVSPQLHVSDTGPEGQDIITVDLDFVNTALADDPDPNPEPKPKPKNDPNPNPKPKGKGDEDDDPKPPEPKDEPEPKPKAKEKHHQPKAKDDPGFDPDKYVSKSDYEELQKQVADLTKENQERVIKARVDHAITEQYIGSDDKEAREKIRKIAANDEAWESYLEVAKPGVPGHIAHQRFQSKNLKSGKHVEDQGILDKVLEHQKAS